MVASNDQLTYPLLLSGSPDEKNQIKKTRPAPIVTPDLDEQEEHSQVAGPLWVGVWKNFLRTMAMGNDEALPRHFLSGSVDEENQIKKNSSAPIVTPDLDEQEAHFQVGGPLWAGVWLFFVHCFIGVFMSSFSYIPYFGQSPVWLRAAILIGGVGNGFFDHLGGYITHPSKFEAVRTGVVLIVLLGLVFFISQLYMVLPAWEAHALVFLLVVLLAAPTIVYKKSTGKEAPTAYGDMVDSFGSWSGVALHLAVDTSGAIWYVFCWVLMGTPSLMGWIQ